MSLESNLVPTSELEAINALLGTIGEEPVSSVSVTGLSDVATAKEQLRLESRRLQSQGWSFNINYEQEFPLTNENEIDVPLNALSFDPSRCETRDGIQRGQRLWNRDTNSWKWDAPIKIDWKVFLPFSDLPESARHLIVVRASRVFQRKMLGSEAIERYNAVDEHTAWADFLRDENSREDNNIYNTFEMQQFLNRTADSLLGLL